MTYPAGGPFDSGALGGGLPDGNGGGGGSLPVGAGGAFGGGPILILLGNPPPAFLASSYLGAAGGGFGF